MARYRLKRKYYGVVDAAGNVLSNTAGGIMQGAGKAMDTTIGGLTGGLLGAPLIAGLMPGLGPLGYLAGAAISSAATRGLGKGLKSAGQDLQS